MSGMITCHVEEGIAEIAMASPPANVMSHAFVDVLLDTLEAAGRDETARVVVISSALAGIFSGGMDLSVVRGATPESFRAFLSKIYRRLFDVQYGMGKPTIAAVHGAARGAGITLAVSCDLIVAAESATFGYPEIDIGVLPGVHFAHLPRQVGRHVAFDLLFTGRTFSAQEAHSLGLVARLAKDGELQATARELAATLAAKPVGGMRIGRDAFMRFNDLDYRRTVEGVIDTLCSMIASEETQSRLQAARQGKRKREEGPR